MNHGHSSKQSPGITRDKKKDIRIFSHLDVKKIPRNTEKIPRKYQENDGIGEGKGRDSGCFRKLA